MLSGLWAYLPVLFLTLLLELLMVSALMRRQPRAARGRALRACIALNVLTHPLATMFLWHGWLQFVPLELLVFLVEASGYRSLVPLSPPRATLLSLCANLTTALASFVWWGLSM